MKRIGLLVVASIVACMPNYSDGERAGYVLKASSKGFLWKSWEGELRMLVPGALAAANDQTTWHFSSMDPEIAKELLDAERTGARVTLTYRQWGCSPPSIDTDYEIVGVAPFTDSSTGH